MARLLDNVLSSQNVAVYNLSQLNIKDGYNGSPKILAS
jgi:hypothetical protein